MNKKRCVICDIDNTLLSQVPRKKIIIEQLFDVVITEEQIAKDFTLDETLQLVARSISCSYSVVKERFEEAFFGLDYYDNSNFSVIENCNDVLQELSEYCDIFYLTARDISLKNITEKQLEAFGFPNADIGHIKFASVTKEKLAGFENESFEKKTKELELLKKDILPVVVVGDRVSDIGAAYVNEIPSIIYSDLSEKEVRSQLATLLNVHEIDIDDYSYISVKKWNEIKNYILHIIGVSDDINDVCRMHSQNYADWLDDLDQKTSLILVIATFCATMFLNLLSSGQSGIAFIFSAVGFVSSIISMAFAIRGFSSRVTHSSETIYALLFKKDDSRVVMPLSERKKISKSRFSSSAGAKYIWNRYMTFDKNSIVSKNLFNLRAANYEKIYPEYYGKCLLYVSIVMLLFIGAINIAKVPITRDNSTVDNTLTTVTQGVLENKPILGLTSQDFDFNKMVLSTKGRAKIDEYLTQNDCNILYLTFPEDLLPRNSKMIHVSERQLYGAIIYDYVATIQSNPEVIIVE